MPIEVAPNRIEVDKFDGGYAPDPEVASLPLNSSPALLNLVIDPGSGALELRKGFSRLSAGRVSALEGTHYFRHINYYEVIDGGQRKRYLVCIATNGSDGTANNVRVYVYDLLNNTFTRVDTAGRSWAKAKTEHWFAIIEGTYYGGTRGEEIYSWHPTNGWDANPTTPSVKSWVADKGNDVDTDTEFARDYAFKAGQKVEFSSKYYSSLRGIRYETWEADEKYSKGKRISRKVNHGSETYWRSFECIKTHTSAASIRPGDGTSGNAWKDYWKNIRLKPIKDEDGDITQDWAYMPLPGKGVVGAYHGFRLFVRHDDSDNWGRVQYSAPAKPEKDSLIADLDWRPTDWAPVDNNRGDGGGWFTVPFGKGDAIRALFSYGQYLLIFGRWQTFALSGTNENTWTLRPVSDLGAIGPQCVTEHDGLVYFMSPTGSLCVTDGTTAAEVPGFEKVREWTKDRVDKLMLGQDTFNWHPAVMGYGAFVLVSLPNDGAEDYTLVYHPPTQSFYRWDIPILDMAVGEKGRAQRMWFVTAVTKSTGQSPTVFEYKDDPGNEVYTDDDWEGGSTTETNAIPFSWRSAWLQFGTTRNERRLRRLWALVKGANGQAVNVRMYRNFVTTAATTAARTLSGTPQGSFAEGKVGQTTFGHSYAIQVDGSASAQFALHGIGLDTEPIRTRFHREGAA